jgi:hypothetical protein
MCPKKVNILKRVVPKQNTILLKGGIFGGYLLYVAHISRAVHFKKITGVRYNTYLFLQLLFKLTFKAFTFLVDVMLHVLIIRLHMPVVRTIHPIITELLSLCEGV